MIICIRKYTFLLLTVILFISMGSMAFAADDLKTLDWVVKRTTGVQWVNTDSVDAFLSFEGSKGFCGAWVVGKPGTTRITGKVVLARKNQNGTYTTVKTWSGLDAAGDELLLDKVYNVKTGYTYRLTITATVYRNGTAETVTDYDEAYAS